MSDGTSALASAYSRDIWDIIEAVGPTVGAFVGFSGLIITAFVVYGLNKRQRRWEMNEERKSLAAAFLGEILAILRIVEYREYVASFQAFLPHLEAGERIELPTISVKQDYFDVYRGNVNRLGLLPAGTAEEVAFHYTRMKSIVEDFDNIGSGRLSDLEPAAQAAYLRSLVVLLTETMTAGTILIERLAEIAEAEER